MRRGIVLVVGMLAGALSLVTAPGAAGATAHRYVAGNAHTIAGAIASDASGLALQGQVETVARTTTLVLTVDDDVVARGTMHVSVATAEWVRHLCVAGGTPVRLTGFTPGERVSVMVWDATFPNGCTAAATTGVIVIAH